MKGKKKKIHYGIRTPRLKKLSKSFQEGKSCPWASRQELEWMASDFSTPTPRARMQTDNVRNYQKKWFRMYSLPWQTSKPGSWWKRDIFRYAILRKILSPVSALSSKESQPKRKIRNPAVLDAHRRKVQGGPGGSCAVGWVGEWGCVCVCVCFGTNVSRENVN